MEDIGPRLRAARSERGLSQRALAERSGVSNAMISLIENGRVNPSLGLLRRILDVMPLSISAFFAAPLARKEPAFFRADELIEIGHGSVSYRQVGRGASHRKIQLLHERYAPGADTGRTLLKHEGEEGGIVISGMLEVTVGDETRLLKAGDAYLFDSTIPHRFRNPGKTPCILVTAATPPSF